MSERSCVSVNLANRAYPARSTARTIALSIACVLPLLGTGATWASAVGTTSGTFSVTPGGGAHYSIPITVPPGTGGMAPKLSVEYDSQAGNGLLGLGGTLAGLSQITRCPASLDQDGYVHNVDMTSADRFCLDGQRLVAISGSYGGNGTEYRTSS